MNHERDEEFCRILDGMDLEEILNASPNESPELLGVVGSPTIEPCNAEGLATLGEAIEYCIQRRILPGALLFIFTVGGAVIIRGRILFPSANVIVLILFEGGY